MNNENANPDQNPLYVQETLDSSDDTPYQLTEAEETAYYDRLSAILENTNRFTSMWNIFDESLEPSDGTVTTTPLNAAEQHINDLAENTAYYLWDDWEYDPMEVDTESSDDWTADEDYWANNNNI